VSEYAERIVCLTEETTETLYALAEDWRIVGISGFTVRPPRARREKPKVSAFTSAKIERILDLEPDLVIGFSDLQADIAAELVRQGINVHVFNHRSVDEIYSMIAQLGGMIGAQDKAQRYITELRAGVAAVQQEAGRDARRPRVYFEEWDEPPISAIRWVSELIGIAGGDDCFAELSLQPLGRHRIIADPMSIALRAPDIIIGSWCGKKFRPDRVSSRPGWDTVPAVKGGEIHEIKSPLILQPGPAALTDGLQQLRTIIRNWQSRQTGDEGTSLSR